MPKIPPKEIDATFRKLLKGYGHYPPDADLADELHVSKRTIVNWRGHGHLPPRPKR